MPKKTKESLVMDASSSFHRRRNDQCSALVVDYDKNVRESSQPIGSHRPLFSLAPNSESLEIFCSEFLQPDLRHARHSTADFQEIQIAIPSSWKFTSTSLPRVRIPPPGLISWEQAASRWEGSLRPFKGLLHLSSVLGQEKPP
jgi:hypothetical protein